MSEAALRSEVVRLGPWHHDVEIARGIRTGEVTRGMKYPPELGTPQVFDPQEALEYFLGPLPGGLRGRSVLDCACNAGGYLFAVKRLGAGRCFGFDAREHWIRQARFIAQHRPEATDVELPFAISRHCRRCGCRAST